MFAAIKKVLIGTAVSSPAEVARVIGEGAFVLDVCRTTEVEKGIAPGAKNIPLSELKHHLNELPHDKIIVSYCVRGGRAGKATATLESNGFKAINGGGYNGILKILESKK